MVASSSLGASSSTTCQPQLPSRQCSPQISHSGSPSLWVSWVKTTFMPDLRARSRSARIGWIVPSAPGTTSVPPSFTKSFCMSPTIRADRRGSTRTPTCTSYSGTSMVRSMKVLPFRLLEPLVYTGRSTFRVNFAPPQYRYNLSDYEGGEDHERAEDLDSHEPVPREPVAEEGGEDGLHGQDDRGARSRDVLLHRGLHQESAGRGEQSRHEQRNPHPWRRQIYRTRERPHDDEEQCQREDLGERQSARVVGGRVAGEERNVQTEGRRAEKRQEVPPVRTFRSATSE